MSFNLKSSNSSINSIAKVLNKLKINSNIKASASKKSAILNLQASYNNKENISADLLLNNNKLTANLNDIYNKQIKLYESDSLSEIWNTNSEDGKIIVEEFTNILKTNLKEEYFEKKDVELVINGKKVKTVNHVLHLTSDNIYELENNVIDGIINNKRLLNALSNVTESDENTLISELSETKNSLEKVDYEILSEIYVSGNDNIEKVSLTITGDTKVVVDLTKQTEDTYKITTKEDEEEIYLGTLTVSSDAYKLNINYDGIKINIDVNEDGNYEINIVVPDYEINITNKVNDNKGIMTINAKLDEYKIDLTVTINYEEKDSTFEEYKSNKEEISLEDMTDTDYSTIYQKLYENASIKELIQDIQNMM